MLERSDFPWRLWDEMFEEERKQQQQQLDMVWLLSVFLCQPISPWPLLSLYCAMVFSLYFAFF